MGYNFNMPSLDMPQDGSKIYKRENESAILLSCAGGLVIGAAFAGQFISTTITASGAGAHTWGVSIYILLGIMFAAIILSCAALARAPQEVRPVDSEKSRTGHLWLILSALILIHSVMALSVCKPGSGGKIDTFTFQRDAIKSLLQGTNPYGTTQTNIYDPHQTAMFYGPGSVVNGRVQVGFQYPPLTLLWVLPGYLLGDVRYSYIFAVILSAVVFFAICPDARGLWIVSALLLSPLTFVVEYLCWTEPLVLMTLCITAYGAARRRWWLPIALGLFLATKQYNFLALPLIGFFIRPFQWNAYWKLTGWSLTVGIATLFPFAFWNFRGMWRDLVSFQLSQPFRSDTLSFAVPFPMMMKIGPLFLAAFIIWAIRAKIRNKAMFAAAYGIALLLLSSTSKQACTNYYFLIGESFFLAAAAVTSVPRKSTGERTGNSWRSCKPRGHIARSNLSANSGTKLRTLQLPILPVR
jgi:hypothetical protein